MNTLEYLRSLWEIDSNLPEKAMGVLYKELMIKEDCILNTNLRYYKNRGREHIYIYLIDMFTFVKDC